MKRTVGLASMLVTMLAGSVVMASGHQLPAYDAYFDAPATKVRPLSSIALSPEILAGVASIDEQRGVPTLYWAPARGPLLPAQYLSRPDSAARFYLEHYAALYGLGSGALASSYIAMVHDTGRDGIIVVFRQKAAGIDVHGVELKVLMTRDHRLVAIAGNLHPQAASSMSRAAKFVQSPESAIARSFNDFFGTKVPEGVFFDTKRPEFGYSFYTMNDTSETLAKGVGLARPARIKKVYFPMPNELVPAYYVEIAGGRKSSTGSVLYSYIIAADDGRMLQRRSLTQDAAFNYRVWSDGAPKYTPMDGPHADYTPHPTGVPDGSSPAFIPPVLVSVDGFNTNPMNTFDPWLAAGATVTTGNNVDAYVDITAPDGFSNGDFRASTTAAGTFDRTYDTTQSPSVSQAQRMASITQLFYNNNYYHDFWYDSGFNEAAGNAQTNNFGRGGNGNDAIHAEGQDYSGTDNSNMQTPADGMSPIMQMYVFSGVANASLTVNPNLTYTVVVADFGGQTFNIGPAQLAYAADGSTADSMGGNTGTVTDACQALTGGGYNGKIVIADRGACNFTVKVKNIQNAGGVGALIANNAAGLPPNPMAGTDNTINIGVEGISQADAATLKQKIQMGATTGTMTRSAALQRDGTIDGGIIGHEWGHYLHMRLAGGTSQQFGAMSEGWGDFQALMQLVHPDDSTNGAFTGTFATGIYASATFGDSAYYGIRRVPYSKDMTKNGLTFKHIGDGVALPAGTLDFGPNSMNSEVHNAGEIWCTMLWESYSNLLNDTLGATPRHTFDQAKRKMADFVVGGLKMAPNDPTYTDQRDGILATAVAAGKTSGDYTDFKEVAAGFATRGAGKCAQSPPKTSTTLTEVVESFGANPEPAFVSAAFVDAPPACDYDGILDAGETGKVAITVQNVGWSDLADATVMVTSTDPDLTFPNGNTAMVPMTAVFDNGIAYVDVKLANTVNMTKVIPLNITINAASACTTTVNATTGAEVHFDSADPNSANASATESFEGLTKTWSAKLSSGATTQLWSIVRPVATGLNEMAWGQDISGVSDHRYESPDLMVGAGAFSVTFSQRYDFERSQGTNWDGAVIEYSADGGTTWADINTLNGVNPGYNGTIDNTGGNPLGGRQGYTGATNGFANGTMNNQTINFGTTLANKTIRLRFRVGCDQLQGAGGWYIDDIAFTGLTNKPFSAQLPEDGMCMNLPPVANAGMDQTVASGMAVNLDGSGSSDPDNSPNPLTYSWTQTAGPAITLTGGTSAAPNFVAPTVSMDTTLTFQLTVSDGAAMASDSVDIIVQAAMGSSSSGTGGMGTGGNSSGGNGGEAGAGGSGGSKPPTTDNGSCNCSLPGDAPAPMRDVSGSLLALFGAWLVRRRRSNKLS